VIKGGDPGKSFQSLKKASHVEIGNVQKEENETLCEGRGGPRWKQKKVRIGPKNRRRDITNAKSE